MVQQQKALLAVAQEQMLVVELEARLLDAEKARSEPQTWSHCVSAS